MASIYSFEIDGWGEVGPLLKATASEGFADGSFTLTASVLIGADEIGAMCWVQDADCVPDGLYTYTLKSPGLMTFQADPADVTVGTFSVDALARVEDHFRISDGVPGWVIGTSALARWYPELVSVSESAGQRLSNTGGLASVDGFEVTVARRQGLAAISPTTYLAATAGPVVLALPLTATGLVVTTDSAAPFAGESASTPGPATSAQPAWVGTEAIDVRGTVSSVAHPWGVTTYTATNDGSATFVTRGVLRTQKQSHPLGSAIFGGMPTPLGQVGRTFVYGEGHASHGLRIDVSRGPIEVSDPSVGASTAIRFALTSSLLRSYRTDSGSASASFYQDEWPDVLSGTIDARIESGSGSLWYWVDINGIAAIGGFTRTGTAPIAISADGSETWEYSIDTTLDAMADFPVVRASGSQEEWNRVALRVDILDEDVLDAWIGRYATPGEWVEEIGAELPLIIRSGLTGSSYAFPPSDAPLAHVFVPVTWPRLHNSDGLGGGSYRWVEINPVDAILTLLTSTGTATNGAHDVGPSSFGMAVPVADIDVSTFTTIGNRLDEEGITAGSVALLGSENVVISEFLDTLLKTYALQVATRTDGTIILIDMAVIDPDTTATLDEGDLVGGPATLELSAGSAVESITIKYARPWISPHMGQKFITEARATTQGISDLFSRIRGETATISPIFAAACDEAQDNALGARWSSVLNVSFGVVGTMSCEVDPGFVPDVGEIVAVTLPAFPNAEDTGGMTGALCRIMDRIHVSRPIGGNPRDTLRLLVYGETVDNKRRRWSPSGLVTASTSPTSFTLSADVYHGAEFASDAASFSQGDHVDVFTANWTRITTVTPGEVASVAGNVITLMTAGTGGSGDVTPSAGDKIALSAESDQPSAVALTWAWLSAATPGYRWE